MGFKGSVTRLSELIADVIEGATIIGGSITGASITADAAVLSNPDISDGTTTDTDHTGGTITGATIVGSTLETGTSGNFIKIWNTLVGGVSTGLIQFFTGNPEANQPGLIETIAQVVAGDFDQLQLILKSPTTTHYTKAAQIEMEPDIAGGLGIFRIRSAIAMVGVGGGALIRAIDFDTVTQNTNASGQIVVTHTLNEAPLEVLLQLRAGTFKVLQVFSISSTQFTVQVRDITGAVVGSGVSCSFFWLALS